MRKNEKENIKLQKSGNTKKMLRVSLAALSLTSALMVNSENVMAASYSGDFRYWSQGGSDYNGMREVGCLITAQAKLLYEANVNRSESFNPDAWYNWLLQNGGIASSTNLNMKDHNAPVYYAKSVNKNLEYLGYWKADDNQLWYNINAGYYTIVHVSGTNTAGSHYVLIDNELSKQTGVLYCYDSFSDRGSVGEQLLSRYSIHNGGHVYKGSNADHTHSYSSSVTAQPACTQPGVKTYSCSCGASYTEAIPKKEHQYTEKVIAPTGDKQGYTLHTCSACNDSYKDTYTDAPKKAEDGWTYCSVLPEGVTADNYTIEYQNYYEKIQESSPGSDWKKVEQLKNEWQNSGDPYTSVEDLPTSDERVLVRSVYYHFCGGSAGNEGNYEQTGNFVHYDEIPATSVTARYLGTDNGHPYYFIDWIDGGGQVWCKSGVSCDSSYGSHGNRCRAWYKMNTYQNRVKVVQNKFCKTSDWTDKKDSSAASVKIRFRDLPESEEPEETAKPEDEKNTTVSGGTSESTETTKPEGTDDSTGITGSNSTDGSTGTAESNGITDSTGTDVSDNTAESTGTSETSGTDDPDGTMNPDNTAESSGITNPDSTAESSGITNPDSSTGSAETEVSQDKLDLDETIEYILNRLKEMLYDLFSSFLAKLTGK